MTHGQGLRGSPFRIYTAAMLDDVSRFDLGMLGWGFPFLVFTSVVVHLAMERYDLGLPSHAIIQC